MEKLNKLFSAAQAGNILELTQLVTSENVNEVNARGFTAFLLAAKHADKSTLQWLIDNGADWKKTKDKRENALFYVVLEHAGQQADRIEKLQFLLSLGLAFEHPSFELVCSDKWHQLKNHWMRDWTYIDQKDCWGCSLLHYASAWGNLPAVRWLSDIAKLYRQHPDTLRGATPLHRASNCDQLEVVQWLVQQPLCKIAFTDKSGWTCLHHAASNGHLAIIEWLIEAKGMSFETKDHYGWTCLHHAANKGYLIIVQWLVEAKRAVLEEKDNYGWGALHHAVNCGHDELTQWLLSKLVLLKEKDSQGDTPLFLALENNNLVQAELLINHMLIHKMTYELLNEKNSSQQTVWLVLAKLGHLPLLQRLFQIGASLEETDQFQNTALLLALKNRYWQVAEWLLVQGSSIDACNYSKQCCLDLAAGFLQTNPKFFERILEYTLLKTKLETLQLRHVALSEYCVERLVQHFINHPTLIHLHLIDIKELTQEHCEKLAIVVSQHKSLVSLKLENCQLTSALLQPILTAVT